MERAAKVMLTDDCITREMAIHGTVWASAHGGYFADPQVARPLVEAAVGTVRSSAPEVIVDLGGGTGYLLGQLMNDLPDPALHFVNVELSPRQLGGDHHPRVHKVCCGLTEFQREIVGGSDRRVLFLMRSVLHYFGKDHLPEALTAIRGHLRPGEYFVHQSACFDDPGDAECLNQLYADMHSPKHYPTTSVLRDLLEKAGFAVESIEPGPPLPLDSAELARRYQIGGADMDRIQVRLAERFGRIDQVFEPASDGFRAWLHYRIFIGRATDLTRGNTDTQ
ncbi:MAG: hypothetical protein GXY44_14905 [Phycisphaerales bacterium]|nr:hypothetical protein [Phycisphaerales bacterium]